MSRLPPRNVPSTLPSVQTASVAIEKWVNAPRMRLGDMSVRQLVETYSVGTVWLTGSTVWMPAVYDEPPPADNDVDLIFAEAADCHAFVQNVMAELNKRAPGYEYKPATSVFGAQKIMFPEEPPKRVVDLDVRTPGLLSNIFRRVAARSAALDNKDRGVLDAWPLAPGQSVGEVLMSYERDHQRVAYSMARSIAGSPSALTRIVRAAARPQPTGY